MKNMFNNIYFVSTLVILALTYVIYTASSFLFSQKNNLSTSEEIIDPLDDLNIENQTIAENVMQTSTDLDGYEINWTKYPKRNPFVAIHESKTVSAPNYSEHFPEQKTTEIAPKEEAELILHAIVVSDNNRFAVVNNTIVSIGQSYENYKITSIEPHFIEMRNNYSSKKLDINTALYEN